MSTGRNGNREGKPEQGPTATGSDAAPPLTNLNNPFFLSYRNRSDQLSEYLSDHNVRLQSSRTVNLLPSRYCRNILNRALLVPTNERKLRRVLYPNSINDLQDSSVNNKIFIPKSSSGPDSLAPSSSTSTTTTSGLPGLLGINSESKFTMKPSLVKPNDPDPTPLSEQPQQHTGQIPDSPTSIYSKDLKQQLELDKAIFIRNNNCINFLPQQQQSQVARSQDPRSMMMIGGNNDDDRVVNGQPVTMPVINSTCLSFCSTGLSSHSRRHLVVFEEDEEDE